MLEAIFPSGIDEITVDGLTQWDKGQILRVDFPDMPTLYEVHFTFRGGTEALIVHVLDGATSNDVQIPNVLLQQPYDLIAYVYLVDSEGGGETVKTVNLPLVKRAKPEDYTDEQTPTQAERIDALLAEIHAQANYAVETADDAKSKAESAVEIANNADTAAASAVEIANDANEKAESAVETANSAVETANAASETANSVAGVAGEAKTTAEEALAAANEAAGAQATADEALAAATDETLVKYADSVLQTIGGTTIDSLHIAIGKYTGTGTYGSSNPSSLSFSFLPKVVIISGGQGEVLILLPHSTSYETYPSAYSDYSQGYVSAKYSGKKVMWYHSSSGAGQMNSNATANTYRYVAIG